MKVAILGASGFLGSNLTPYLDNEGFNVHELSLRNPDWKSTIKDVSAIINLVGKAHDHNNEASEGDFYSINVDLVKDIYSAFLESDANILIHISSLAALEEIKSNKALTEEFLCNPSSWYGRSKREAEVWLLDQKLPVGKKIFILRPPMIHGPGDKGNLGLLYKFISKGIPYPLAAFDNKRSFISIDNFSFFINDILRKSETLNSGLYHIADDESMSTKDIIAIMKDVTRKKGLNISVPPFLITLLARIGDFIPIYLNTNKLSKMTGNLLVSNEKIKRSLGLSKLPFSAKEGLKKTIMSFNQNK